jgi:glycosyltransferase involved in cell wall biosynthesis
MGKIAVSIIIPTYNRADLIGRAVNSILKQTFTDFEIIIIDDGSNDNTPEIIRGFHDPRIKYIRLEQNIGAAAARNMGIREAKSDFIAFQDSDNEWFEDKLEKQMNAFSRASEKVGVVYSGIWRIGAGGKVYVPSDRRKGGAYKKKGDIHSEILMSNFIDLSAAIVRKECFSKVGGFDEKLPCMQDWELWIRMSKEYEFEYMDESMANVYYTGDSISVDPDRLITAYEYILVKHFDKFKEHKRTLSRQYAYLGDLLCERGDMTGGRSYFIKAMKAFILDAAAPARFALSLFGGKTYKNVNARFRKDQLCKKNQGSR